MNILVTSKLIHCCVFALVGLHLLPTGRSFAQDAWVQTHGPYGGLALSLAVNSSGDVYAGTVRGLYRSSDQGGHWTIVGRRNSIIYSLAINASNHIFSGTLPSNILRSTDGGKSWRQFNVVNGSLVRTLALN